MIAARNRPSKAVPMPYFDGAGAAGAGVAAFGGAGAGNAGAGKAGAGVAGAVCFDVFENCCNTELPEDATFEFWCIVKAIDVIMNMIAHHVVALVRNVAAPRGPNAVWLPAPPNAPARSAASPLCSNTTIINTAQIRMCSMMSTK